MKYSVVIPTYNHCEDLLKPCVESLLKYSRISDVELIISANGCKDTTFEYLGSLREKFNYLGLKDNLKIVWTNEALGFSRATNAGIEIATTDLIVLLNNDTILLEQPKNVWLMLLEQPFLDHLNCGITCIIKGPSAPAGRDFAVFFCVMVHKKVFNKIGLLNTDYGVGGGEDTEFCIEAENAGFEVRQCIEKTWSEEANLFVGNFPIYHKGEGTMHDPKLVPDWSDIFLANSIRLAKKYNPNWYQWRISNNSERAVFFKGDEIFPREATRYKWAAENTVGKKVFELGCSSGFGAQFFPKDIQYTGLDYDSMVIQAATEQQWGDNTTFVCEDINKHVMDEYDTIVAFETIEHLTNGLDVVEKLKKHCDTLLISVPRLEPADVNNPHHHMHLLQESHFPGFEFKYINEAGKLLDTPDPAYNVMLCKWTRPKGLLRNLTWLKEQDELIYSEVITENQYRINEQNMTDRNVIDIGANVGMFSLLAASLGAEKVIGVEANSNSHRKFLDNIKHSGFKTILTMRKIVTSTGGSMGKLNIDPVNPGRASLYTSFDHTEINIPTIILADILVKFKGNDIFLKLDCEGSEFDILLNATQKDMDRISEIAIEIHEDLHPKYKSRKLIEDALTKFGFTRSSNDQVYAWDVDAAGNKINWRELSYLNQHWIRASNQTANLEWLKEQDPKIYGEVFTSNHYRFSPEKLKGRNVIDIGANLGMVSLYASYCGAKKVVAVEPVKEIYDKFVSNIKRAGYKNIVALKNVVLDKAGKKVKVSINNEPENTGANSIYNVVDQYEGNIISITLSDILKQFKGDNIFLKLDCEGAEFDIIPTATKKD